MVCFPDKMEHAVNIFHRFTALLEFQKSQFEPMRQTVKIHKKGKLFSQKSRKSSFLAELATSFCSQFTLASWNVVKIASFSPKIIITENDIKPLANFLYNYLDKIHRRREGKRLKLYCTLTEKNIALTT